MGDRLRHQARVGDRGQGDVADPVGEVAGHLGRGRHGQPGLAHPTGTGQGQQAIWPAQGRGRCLDLALTPDEGRERDRERAPDREGLAGERIPGNGSPGSGAAPRADAGVIRVRLAGIGIVAREAVEVREAKFGTARPV